MRGQLRIHIWLTLLLITWASNSTMAQNEFWENQQNPSQIPQWAPAPVLPTQFQAIQNPVPYPHPQQAPVSQQPQPIQPVSAYPPPPVQQTGFRHRQPLPSPGYQPYPGIDLFRYGHQQTLNRNGLWFQDLMVDNKSYEASIEFIVPRYSSPSSLFGYTGPQTGVVATDTIPPFYHSMPRNTDDITDIVDSTIVPRDLFDRYFKPLSFDDMVQNSPSTGIKLTWGKTNEDGSGFQLFGWYGGESNHTFQQGAEPTRNYVPGVDPDTSPNDPVFVFELSALNGGLTVNDGSNVAIHIPFDQMYQMRYSTEVWGTGLHLYKTAIHRGSWYSLRPVIGIRYTDVLEGFAFRGLDSGAEYTILSPDDQDLMEHYENLFLNEFENNTDGPSLDGSPDIDDFNDGTIIEDVPNSRPLTFLPTNPYETQIKSSTHSRVAGPEVGLRLDMGGKNTKMWIQATGGLAANAENIKLSGFGVYNHFIDNDNDGFVDGGELGTGNGDITSTTTFSQKTSNTVLTPMFDTSINMEFNILPHVPILNMWEAVDNSMFRITYGYFWLGNVSRPQDSVAYNAFPINPQISTNRGSWSMTHWDFSFVFTY